MDYAIDALILVFGSVGSFAALCGDTWRAQGRWYRRMTRQGWVAASCLVVALAIGLYKEHRSIEARRVADARIERLQKGIEETSEQAAEAKRLEAQRLADQRRSDEEKKKAKAEEDARFSAARTGIRWVIRLDRGAQKRYAKARRDKSKYEAVLKAQDHNEDAQATIRAYGEARTTKYIEELGG